MGQQAQALRCCFPDMDVDYCLADFAHPLGLPPLDGIVLANALHFKDKGPALRTIFAALRPGGRLVLVEYDTDQGNRWVPFPCSFAPWRPLARGAGFADTRLLATRPSRFLGQLYAAGNIRPSAAGDERR
ncbi:MAG: class I SAM-dependent methyltransferase [Chloroflexi bacterium]|nr:class I SAM-dependent methyltransferase [Chloroflexota bacterium]